jgi:hypothetical protein
MKKYILILGLVLSFSIISLAQTKLAEGVELININKVPPKVKEKLLEKCNKEKLRCSNSQVYKIQKKKKPEWDCKICISWFDWDSEYCLFCKHNSETSK